MHHYTQYIEEGELQTLHPYLHTRDHRLMKDASISNISL
jgi:hypothetical protein